MTSIPQTADRPAAGPGFSRPGWGRLCVLALLLAAGGVMALAVSFRGGPPGLRIGAQGAVLVVAGLLSFVPFVHRNLQRGLDVVRYPSPGARARTAAAVGVIAFAYLLVTARQQHRDLFPRLHDECSYTIQAHMMAEGRLWQPRHPLGDFFETFHFLTAPVYGSIYFPGTALMNVPGVWLRQGSWVVPLLLAALVIAMSYRVTAELVDGAAGLLVALLIAATSMFRVYSTMVMAQVPLMLLALLMAWAWLHWRRERKWGWAALIGLFAGWAAITRPVDALAFALPVGLAMAWQLRSQPMAHWARNVLAVALGALPFLALQLVFDAGVTGAPLKTPYVLYLEQNQPGSVFGSGAAMDRPQTELRQKQIYYAQLTGAETSQRKAGGLAWAALRLRMTATATLPFAALLILVPAGLLLARERGRWVVLLAAPVFLLAYAFNPFFLLHYAIPLAAAAALCGVLGARAVEQALPRADYQRRAGTFLTGGLVLLALFSLPQLNPRVSDEPYRTPLLDRVEQAMAEIPGPAVVFFRFTDRCNVHEEPVYNLDATWPDDAPIIRAQDLGPRNGELLRYYAERQPGRTYYMMDRYTGILLQLGNAQEAAVAMHVPLDLPRTATADLR